MSLLVAVLKIRLSLTSHYSIVILIIFVDLKPSDRHSILDVSETSIDQHLGVHFRHKGCVFIRGGTPSEWKISLSIPSRHNWG